VLLFVLSSNTRIQAQEKGNDNPPDERLRQAVLQAKTYAQAGKAYRALFKRLDREGLANLENDPDPGIALQAAWELHVARAIAAKRIPQPQRFLGFLEGRTRLRIPLRWEIELATTSVAHSPDRIAQTMDDYLPIAPFITKRKDGTYREEAQPVEETTLGPHVPADTRLKRTDGMIAITVGKATVTIEDRLFRQLKKEIAPDFTILRVALGPKQSYLVWYEPTGHSFPVVCLDSQSGKVLWKTTSWASGSQNLLGYGGQMNHDVELVPVPGKLLVFGSVFVGDQYLEAFSSETGSCLFRFSSSRWCIRDR
jgi:hypothetical protein